MPGVLPGRTVDITAARRFKIAEKMVAFLGPLGAPARERAALARESGLAADLLCRHLSRTAAGLARTEPEEGKLA